MHGYDRHSMVQHHDAMMHHHESRHADCLPHRMTTEFESSYATKLSNEELAELVQLYKNGATLAQLARKYKVTEIRIRLALKRATRKGL